jgi:predicted GH43/DUF377 family glycosyl hydrolase
MFYLGTPNTTPGQIGFQLFLTMKAKSKSLKGPWIKQYDITPLPAKEGSFYTATAGPGFIVKFKNEYLQFFIGGTQDSTGIKRTLGIARTKNLNNSWKIDSMPIIPLSEQVENSSLFFDKKNKTWYLFTNHIGMDQNKTEYTDAIWVYWSKDINKWDNKDKAIVLDSLNCAW